MDSLKEQFLKYNKETNGENDELSLQALFDKPRNLYELFLESKLAERDTKIAELEGYIEKQRDISFKAVEAAHQASRLELSVAQNIQASTKPEMLESERQMNEILTNENLRLEDLLDAKLKILKSIEQHIARESDCAMEFDGYSKVVCVDELIDIVKGVAVLQE